MADRHSEQLSSLRQVSDQEDLVESCAVIPSREDGEESPERKWMSDLTCVVNVISRSPSLALGMTKNWQTKEPSGAPVWPA